MKVYFSSNFIYHEIGKKNWNEQAFTVQASGRQAQLWPGGEEMKKRMGKRRNGRLNRYAKIVG